MKMLAITQIWRSTGRMTPTGIFDREGNPKLRVQTDVVHAGTVFVASDNEAEELIANGAAAPVEDHDPHSRKNAPEQTEEGN